MVANSTTLCASPPACSMTCSPRRSPAYSPHRQGRRLKIYYMTQASTKPPTFVCFVNSAELFHFLPAVSRKPHPGNLRAGGDARPLHHP